MKKKCTHREREVVKSVKSIVNSQSVLLIRVRDWGILSPLMAMLFEVDQLTSY